MKKSSLSSQIRQIVNESDISRYKLSQESGVDKNVLRKFLEGETDARASTLDKIAKVLNIEAEKKSKV